MKAIILAAGRGSRMKQATQEIPKCLVVVQGQTLLDRQLASLRTAGIDEIAIVTGYRRELLAERGLTEFHNPYWEKTNMVSSLACADVWLRNEPCIVSYSDIFYRPTAPSSLLNNDDALAITYDPNWRVLWEKRFANPLDDAETFRLDAQGKLLEIGHKPSSIAAIEGQYMGLLRFTPAAWQEVNRLRHAMPDEMRDRMHMTGTLQKIIEAGRITIRAIPYVDAWGEIDSMDDLALY